MALADLYGPRVRLAWLLEISGLTVRYYSGQAPPTRATGLGVNYTDVQAFPARGGVGSQRVRLDEAGGVAEYGPVAIRLASRGDTAADTDPARQLLRATRGGATRFTRLATSLVHDTAGPATVEVTDDLTGWQTIGGLYVFHVGQEAFSATGIAAGPYRFTGVTRSVLDTRPQAHLVDPARGYQPIVTSEPVTWRTRRARLKVAPITGASLANVDYAEVVRGFIDRAPRLDGADVTFDLAALPSLLEAVVGDDSAVTHLLRGWHYFTPGAGTVFAHTQIAKQGLVVNEQLQALVGIGAAAMTVGSNATVAEMSDPTRADEHPRSLPLVANVASPSDAYIPTGTAGTQTVNFAPNTTVAIAAGLSIFNRTAWDVIEYDIAPSAATMVAWPDDALAEVRVAWGPGTVAGASGAWVDAIPVELDGSPALSCKINGAACQQSVTLEWRADWSTYAGGARDDYYPGQGYVGRSASEMAHYGFQCLAPDDSRWFDSRERGAFGEEIRRDTPAQTRWYRREDVSALSGRGDNRDILPIRGWPLAYFQTGEPSFDVESDILGSPTNPQHVLISWAEGGEKRKQLVKVASTADADDPAGTAVGARFTLADGWPRRTRSFGDWTASERTEVRAVAAWTDASAAQIIRELLISGRGRSVNGTQDVQPYGANLNSSDDVHVASLLARTAVAVGDSWTFAVTSKRKLKDTLNPILRATGTALVLRRQAQGAGGRMRISLVPVGLETASEVVASIGNGDILSGSRPSSALDDTRFGRYSFKVNYDVLSDEPGLTIGYVDADAVAENGGDVGDSLDVDLRGLRVPEWSTGVADILPLVNSLRARLGRPRRRYTLGLHGGWGVRLAAGDVVQLTATDALRYSGARGVSAATCRVVGIVQDWEAWTTEVELTSYEANTAGWAPAMIITGTPTVNTLTVSDNYYTESQNLATQVDQTDADWFAVGDQVYIIPRGNYAAGVAAGARTITARSGSTITIPAHGATVGSTIRPVPYDLSVARMQGYVHAADAAGTLGAAGDAAKVWA